MMVMCRCSSNKRPETSESAIVRDDERIYMMRNLKS